VLEQLAFAEIVVSDLVLSDDSSLELIEAIGQRLPRLPVIAMSGNPALPRRRHTRARLPSCQALRPQAAAGGDDDRLGRGDDRRDPTGDDRRGDSIKVVIRSASIGDESAGPPPRKEEVLFLHGWTGSGPHHWRRWLAAE
jgi:CheY-like chemotaxis protein